MPEKAYYSDAKYQEKRDAFVAHVEKMLVLGGIDAASAKAQAQTVLKFETRLAAASLSPVEGRNPANQYNFVSIADADKATPNFSWTKLLAAENINGVKGFSLSQPKFFAEILPLVIGRLISVTTISSMQHRICRTPYRTSVLLSTAPLCVARKNKKHAGSGCSTASMAPLAKPSAKFT